jgi:hypothetical protein
MHKLNMKKALGKLVSILFVSIAGVSALSVNAMAQYAGGGIGGARAAAATAGGATAGFNFNSTYHVGFDRPEAWGLKYFASTTLLSGLQPPEQTEGPHFGSVSIAFELGSLPTLDAGETRIGFGGKSPEALNKAPIFARPVVRLGLPGKFSVVVAIPPPIKVFGVASRLVAFGLERPLLQQGRWTVGWRGYGQLGSVKGAFTCPTSVLPFAPGSPQNPTECVGESSDVATLRYAGSEFQFAYRIPGMPKLVPHAAAGGNFIDGAFQVHAPVEDGLDQTRLWTHGGTFSATAGISYLITKRTAFVVDAFYSPLFVQRSPSGPASNDGLFNVRALISYAFR